MKKVAVVRERFPGERRVALLPENVEKLNAAGYEVLVEHGAGNLAGISDELYEDAGATLTDRSGLAGADVLVQVRSLGANSVNGHEDLELLDAGQLVIGMCDPLGNAQAIERLSNCGVSQIALEMVPRITKAQSMDVLSSMATIAGYRAVLHAAYQLPRMFPLNMTAAGTLAAAKVFIIGAGVAGLQAAATAKRLGAIVSAFDVRPDCREQVESVGARFVEFELESDDAEDAGGYAREQTEEYLTKQREFMAQIAAEHDIVITTAAIPGRQSPLLLTSEAVEGMANGSVIVDLAAERGGNCSETQADETIVVDGVTILGPTNLPAEIPYHASQMFGNNVTTILMYLINEEGEIELDLDDDILSGCLVTKDGEIVNQRIGGLLGVTVESPAVEAAAKKQAEGSDQVEEEAQDRLVQQDDQESALTPTEDELGEQEDNVSEELGDTVEKPKAEMESVELAEEQSYGVAADPEGDSDTEEDAETGYPADENEYQEAEEEVEEDEVEEYEEESEEDSEEHDGDYEELEETEEIGEAEEEEEEDEYEVEEDEVEEYEEESEEDSEEHDGDYEELEETEEIGEAEEEEEEDEYEVEEDEVEEYEEESEEHDGDYEELEETEEIGEAEEEEDADEEDEDSEYELEDYDAEADYTDDDDEPDYDFSDYEEQ